MVIMRRIVVVNIKGGCGKTTIATNIASRYAAGGYGVALLDYDPQGSSMNWLKQRPTDFSPVHGIAAHHAQHSVTRTFALRVPAHISRIVVDTPAGLKGYKLSEQLKDYDVVIIPVVPSAIDIHASADFMRDLLVTGKARARHMRLAIIGNRIRMATPALQSFEVFLDQLHVPVIARLRDSGNYLLAAEQGVGVHELELPELPEAQQDRLAWDAIVDWIESEPRPV